MVSFKGNHIRLSRFTGVFSINILFEFGVFIIFGSSDIQWKSDEKCFDQQFTPVRNSKTNWTNYYVLLDSKKLRTDVDVRSSAIATLTENAQAENK